MIFFFSDTLCQFSKKKKKGLMGLHFFSKCIWSWVYHHVEKKNFPLLIKQSWKLCRWKYCTHIDYMYVVTVINFLFFITFIIFVGSVDNFYWLTINLLMNQYSKCYRLDTFSFLGSCIGINNTNLTGDEGILNSGI